MRTGRVGSRGWWAGRVVSRGQRWTLRIGSRGVRGGHEW